MAIFVESHGAARNLTFQMGAQMRIRSTILFESAENSGVVVVGVLVARKAGVAADDDIRSQYAVRRSIKNSLSIDRRGLLLKSFVLVCIRNPAVCSPKCQRVTNNMKVAEWIGGSAIDMKIPEA